MSELAEAITPQERAGLIAPLFGAAAAPIVWLGQVMLAYSFAAYACYPGDHPVVIRNGGLLHAVLIGFDAVAVAVALAGALTAFWCLKRAEDAASVGAGRARFLALWGVFSSLCFLAAILFNIIASLTVPLCVR